MKNYNLQKLEYSKAIKQRDKYENELNGIQEKLKTARKIKQNNQSWLNNREEEYKEFLKVNELTASRYEFD